MIIFTEAIFEQFLKTEQVLMPACNRFILLEEEPKFYIVREVY